MPQRLVHWMAGMRSRPPLERALLLGLFSALLPCGWLYAFAIAAAGSATALTGAAILLAFWAGNLPFLLGLGAALGGVLGRLRQHVPLASALLIFSLGLFTVMDRVNLPALAVQAVTSAAPDALPPMPRDCPYHARGEP
jgi:sulfite exporter TauE/SafE